ncbi:MAG: TIGR03663 family protein, partial [Anaerolineales bacterium]|nr:TIGR03663 family protein [Anaerolineales bacterium]MDW8227848.1 TIGR03663 family protein [Anaerolineales bacterium]
MTEDSASFPSLLDTPLKKWIPLSYENLLATFILVLAVISRFYDLGARAMSHDEINHVVPTYNLYTGYGYTYDPMSHGPLQFHLIGLSYALFGDNDYTTRIPAALFGVATVAVGLLLFRRYLGRVGAIAAGLLLLISPYLLFYGRYARNEIFIVLWALLLLYSTLRYLERGERWGLVLFVLTNALHFTDKATSYMFAGGIFIFLFFYFIDQAAHRSWTSSTERTRFLLGIALFILLSTTIGVTYLLLKPETSNAPFPLAGIVLLVGLGILAGGMLVLATLSAVRGLGLISLHSLRSLDLLLLLGTLMLPMVAAIPLELLGLHPLDYSLPGLLRIFVTVLILGGLGASLGLFWFGKRWLLYAAVFFLPILILYTTFFTNPGMSGSGFVGAFAYWLEQHGEQRGSQPIFYYALIQIPIYEFLPAIGTFLAALIAAFGRLWLSAPGQPFVPATSQEGQEQPVPTAALTVYWSAFSLAIFSYAGERMPWLTCHITLPMILATAWAIGWLVETAPEQLGRWRWRMATRTLWLV